MKIFRPAASSIALALFSALFIVLAYNHAFWSALFNATGIGTYRGSLFAASVLIVHVTLLTAVFLILGIHRMLKPLIVLLLLIASVIGYFEVQFGTIIDRGMIQNIVETDRSEAGELMNTGLFIHVFLTGSMPVLLL